jgi:hypothetical protein
MPGVDWSIADPTKGFDYLQSLQTIGQAQAQRVQTQTNQFALRQRQRQDELRPAIAARLGQNDFAGAQQQAVSVGDDELATRIGGLHDQHFADLMRQNDARGNVAYTLAQIKDPAQRAAVYQSHLPYLKGAGLTDADLANPDLSDQALQAHIADAQGLDSILKQHQEERQAAQRDRELNQGDVRNQLAASGQNLEERKFGYEQHKPIPVAYGTSLIDPTTRAVVYDGSGGLNGSSGGAMPTDPAGIASQIKAVEGFAKNPNSTASGAGQMINSTFIDTYRKTFPDRAGLSNSQILAKRGTGVEEEMLSNLTQRNMAALSQAGIAPNAANTYVMHFLGTGDGMRALRADPSAPLSSVVSASAIAANPTLRGMSVGDFQQWAAKKMTSGGGASGGGAGGLGADAIDRMATDYNRTHKIPPGFTKNPAAVAAIQNRAAQQLHEQGGTASTSLADSASVHADSAGLAALQRRATTMNASETAAKANAGLVLQLLPAVGNGSIPVFNAWKNAAGKNTGEPNISKLNAAVETFANEYSTVMGKGVPTDGLRAHAHEMINTSQSPAQLRGVVSTLMRDMANQRQGFAQERQETLARISGGSGGSAGGIPSAAIAHLRQNPQLASAFDQKYGAGASSRALGR